MSSPAPRRAARGEFDAIVVGASAAGLLCATRLAEAGRSVVVLEAAAAVEPEPRSLIVTSRLLDVAGDAGAASVVNEIDTFELVTGGHESTIPLTTRDLIIERATLVKALYARAMAAGVEILLGHRFVRLDSAAVPTVVADASGETITLSAPHVVGADGAFSKVAQAAGWPERPTAPLLQAIVKLPAGFAPGTTRVWFVPEDTPYFYWLIPDGPGRGALGVIGEDASRTRRLLDRFLAREGFAPIEYQAARIPIYTRWMPMTRRVNGGHVHVVGDAAGHVKVTTVGGIVTGLRGALAIAALITAGRRDLVRAARWELDAHLLIRRALHRFDAADYRRLIEMLGAGARRTLGVVTRDEAFGLALRLALRQPRLVALGLRGLMASAELSPPASRPFRADVDYDPLPPS